jgi:hypothetical protein
MSSFSAAFSAIPDSHRKPLLEEYNSILSNYMEQRWSPSEMSGGRFAEIVYSILESIASGTYTSKPSMPRGTGMESACKNLESKTTLPRGFRILIPRMLPALYEVRNNRGVGHVGGDVDPNHMDATFVLSTVNWIMAEMARELHSLPVKDAQKLVDALAERRIPLVWEGGNIRRVLDTKMPAKDQILVLTASCSDESTFEDLLKFTEYKNKTKFRFLIRGLHTKRYIEFDGIKVKLLPPGKSHVSAIIKKYADG